MMKLQDLIVMVRSLYDGPRSSFGFVVLLFVGVMFSPNPPLWELCCSLVLSLDGTGLGNIFGGGSALRGNFF